MTLPTKALPLTTGAATGRARLPAQSEKSFQAGVVELARLFRWTAFYTHDSRHSPAGWPDLVLLRKHPRPRMIAAELKRESGKVSLAQAETLALLEACGVETFVWRPSQKAQIAQVLR